jgi:hypothetical protein
MGFKDLFINNDDNKTTAPEVKVVKEDKPLTKFPNTTPTETSGGLFGSGGFLITAIFPIIYRICKTGLIIKNVPDLIQKFDQFITDNREVISDLHGTNFDAEAELCSFFAEDYCEWIKNNPEMDPIKYIPKHKL